MYYKKAADFKDNEEEYAKHLAKVIEDLEKLTR